MACIRYGQLDPSADHQRDRQGVCVICGEAVGGVVMDTRVDLLTEAVDTRASDAMRPVLTGTGCKRGDQRADKEGKPFPHVNDPVLGYCIFCGLGAPPPPPVVPDKTPETEIVGCPEHGFHKIAINNGIPELPPCLKGEQEAGAK